MGGSDRNGSMGAVFSGPVATVTRAERDRARRLIAARFADDPDTVRELIEVLGLVKDEMLPFNEKEGVALTDDVLSMDEAMRLLRKEVANKGESHVYTRPGANLACYYFWQGQPSCVVGHALASGGIADPEATPNPSWNWAVASDLPSRLPIDKSAATVFRAAQRVQDEGGTWGQALAAAEQEYRELGGTE